ncbi:uncharacterized protein MalAC0309_0261 [Microcella alkaliphila]|uniref:Uncharacterized protein n=1 Tax=Microcella alkaliphila TaxID=279828 RepID=A0A0U5B5E6_9MICO|nr:uncharacterized protein MalAC0309_0261 [Microcella alkaliphila]
MLALGFANAVPAPPTLMPSARASVVTAASMRLRNMGNSSWGLGALRTHEGARHSGMGGATPGVGVIAVGAAIRVFG